MKVAADVAVRLATTTTRRAAGSGTVTPRVTLNVRARDKAASVAVAPSDLPGRCSLKALGKNA